MNVRWLQTNDGRTILQKYAQVGTDRFGHVIFGWVEIDTVLECELPDNERTHPGDRP